LDFYEATLDRSALERAVNLTEIMLREFWDSSQGGFFYTGNSHEQLISRTKPVFDASVPSGNAKATELLLRLYHLTGKEDFLGKAETVLSSYSQLMESQPFGFAHLLCALDFYLRKPKDVVVLGEPDDSRTTELLRVINSLYLPSVTVQLVGPDKPPEEVSPLLVGKTQINGSATAYVCQNHTCSAPVTRPEELRLLLISNDLVR
jgi:uncharacterized protein YyaL (SSP411 family)